MRKQRHQRRWWGWVALAAVVLWLVWYGASGRLTFTWNLYRAKTSTLNGQYSRALALYAGLELVAPNDPRLTDGVGFVYLHQGLLDQAQDKYNQAARLGLKPNWMFNHVQFGRNFFRWGRYQEALVEFKHAVDIDPKGIPARRWLAVSYHALCQIDQSVAEYKEALTIAPGDQGCQDGLELAKQDKNKGSVAYMFDRREQPLARQVTTGTGGLSTYPFGQYTAHVVGFRSLRHGSSGLEKALEHNFPGNKIYLTLDGEFQRACSKILGWNKGAVVAMDPRTGEILAALSQPYYNPNQVDETWWKIVNNPNKPMRNRAFEALYSPGSIAKLITTAAALEHHVDIASVFPVRCRGSLIIDGQPFWDWKKHKTVNNLEGAFDLSCNVAYAKLGQILGKDMLFEYTNKFGVLKTPPLEVPTLPGKTSYKDTPYEVAEWSTGIGKGYVITPLHAVFLAAAVANDGVVMKPFLVKEIRSFHDDLIKRTKPEPWFTAIRKNTARELNRMLVETTIKGIGKKAAQAVTGIQVAGKTGTTGSVNTGGLNGWFICFAPAENPTIALAVYVEQGGTGMDVAAPIAGKILEAYFKGDKKEVDE